MHIRLFTLVLAVAGLTAGCGPSASESLQRNKELIRHFVAVTNTADWDALDGLLTENFRRHCQATPDVEVNSREEFKQLQKSFLASMPDQHIELEMLIAEGDKVAIYATYSGTQTGPMGNFPITGKSVESKFMAIFRIEESRIAELWVEWDNVAMLTQLGLFPPTPAGGG